MGVLKKFLGLFKKNSNPKRIDTRGGHRGIGIGSAKEPDFSQGNILHWKYLDNDSVQGFIYNQETLFVHSTNVIMAQYFFESQKMMIEFKGGRAYMYSEISEEEAADFCQAQSKGIWTWDNLRVRGSVYLAKKPYARVK